jgi:hypothetical protein
VQRPAGLAASRGVSEDGARFGESVGGVNSDYFPILGWVHYGGQELLGRPYMVTYGV